MFKKNIFAATTFLVLGMIVSGCSVTENTEASKGKSMATFQLSQDEMTFVNKFLASYDIERGQTVDLGNNVSLRMYSSTIFFTTNMGSDQDPRLQLIIDAPTLIQSHEVDYIQNHYKNVDSYEIIDANTAIFNVEIKVADGRIINQQITVEIKDYQFFINGVAIATQYVPVNLQSFTASGVTVGELGSASMHNAKGNEMLIRYQTSTTSGEYSLDLKKALLFADPSTYRINAIIKFAPTFYQIKFDNPNIVLNIYTISDIGRDSTIYAANIERITVNVNNGQRTLELTSFSGN